MWAQSQPLHQQLDKTVRILLDLDCTLADFVAGAAAAHGLTARQVLAHWPAGGYDMAPAVGRAAGWPPDRDWDEAFWAPLNGSRKFWADLPVLPWANELFVLVLSLTDDWWIVTSPSRCELCVPGKMDWCRRFLGLGCSEFDRLVPLRHKYLLANPTTLLVDDSDANVDAFVAAGGHGLLLPAHHNRYHHWAADPMRRVRPRLRYLKENPLCT